MIDTMSIVRAICNFVIALAQLGGGILAWLMACVGVLIGLTGVVGLSLGEYNILSFSLLGLGIVVVVVCLYLQDRWTGLP